MYRDVLIDLSAALPSGLLLHFLLFPMSRDVPVKRKQLVRRLAESKRPACRTGKKHNFCEKFSFDNHCAQAKALETKRNRSQKLALRCVSSLLSSIIAQKCIQLSAGLS